MPAGCKLVTIPSFVEVMHPFDNVNERSNMLGNSFMMGSGWDVCCRPVIARKFSVVFCSAGNFFVVFVVNSKFDEVK